MFFNVLLTRFELGSLMSQNLESDALAIEPPWFCDCRQTSRRLLIWRPRQKSLVLLGDGVTPYETTLSRSVNSHADCIVTKAEESGVTG